MHGFDRVPRLEFVSGFCVCTGFLAALRVTISSGREPRVFYSIQLSLPCPSASLPGDLSFRSGETKCHRLILPLNPVLVAMMTFYPCNHEQQELARPHTSRLASVHVLALTGLTGGHVSNSCRVFVFNFSECAYATPFLAILR